MSAKTLGRGLSAFLDAGEFENNVHNLGNDSGISKVQISKIVVNKDQPRKFFDNNSLSELSESIKQHGILQPILVKQLNDGNCKIIAGERRFRAAVIAGLSEIPVIFCNLDDPLVLEVSILENVQRENLNIMEEAEGYRHLIDDFGYTQEKIAQKISKSRAHVANILRLNSLPDEVKQFLRDGRLSFGHARCLLGLENCSELSRVVIDKGLSVRQTENLVKSNKNINFTSEKIGFIQDPEILEIQERLSSVFGLNVKIKFCKTGGVVEFYFDNLRGLDGFLQKVT